MPEYLVTTHDNRNLIVESDYFEHNNSDSYDFFTKEEGKTRVLVASINAHSVLGVVEYEEAFKADFYDDGPNLLGSEDFFKPVYDIVDSYHEPDGPEPLTVFQGQYKGSKSWGFWFFDDKREVRVFVPFGDRDHAEHGLQRHKDGERNWETWPLSETTPVEEAIQ